MKIYSIIFLLGFSLSIFAFQAPNFSEQLPITPLIDMQPMVQTQQEEQKELEWLSLEEAMDKQKTDQKKILVNVYKDWCAWCKQMEEVTFQDTHVINFINKNFYPVKLDAEDEESIEFKDKVYGFAKTGQRGYHELAVEMLGGRMSFPTVVFLDENLEIIQPLNGYKPPEDFEKIIMYFAQNHYKKTPWSTFERQYKTVRKD